jgi:hypothetical protein
VLKNVCTRTDPISGALLSSATAPAASSKAKTIQLYNPDSATELRSVGTLSFRWAFKWEECVSRSFSGLFTERALAQA